MDADLRAYVCDCLRARTDLRVIGDSDTAEHVRPDLVITDRVHRDRTIPLLLLSDDPLAYSPSGGSRLEVLMTPFNARQLLQAVERLLGPAG
jgi:hypothetical protein